MASAPNRRPPYDQHYPPPPQSHPIPHPPSTPIDHHRPPPPPFPSAPYPTYPPPPASGPALAPITAHSHHPAHSLPPLQHHPQHQQHPPAHPPPPSHAQHQLQHPHHLQQHPHPPPHEARDASEYSPYNTHSRSNQATPAPIPRSYSVDSAPQQRTPTTPAHPTAPPGSYPPAPAPEAGPPHLVQPMEHGTQHYPPPNGLPHGLPPTPHPQGPPPGPPQHSEYMTPVMENHHPYPPPGIYPTHSYGPTSNNYTSVQKRKQMRATQACEQCRSRKQKCDEGNPCSFCKEQSLTCQYRDTPPAKTDKNMEKLLQHMETHTQQLDNLTSKIDEFDNRLRSVEQSGLSGYNGGSSNDVAMAETTVPGPNSSEEDVVQPQDIDDHRTAPHKLILLWPSVSNLLKAADVNVSDSYVMEAEDRGVLRIWTYGEGVDEPESTQQAIPASPAHSEDSGEANTPSPPQGFWGNGFASKPSSDASRSESCLDGGLKPDGTLDLDINTIATLHESYMKHIHVMHPFLDRLRLRKLIEQFSRRYGTGVTSMRHKFAVSNSDSERPMKRQRSNGSTATGTFHSEHVINRNEPTERSPGNAIVWLVLALGKVCMMKEPLQHPIVHHNVHGSAAYRDNVSSGHTITGSSPMNAAVKPNETSPKSTPTAQATPSSLDGVMRVGLQSRRASIDTSRQRNLDQVAGLAYYAKAAEIMGDQGDGNDLVHAQMFLLAALYKGQFARVKESMSWYCLAGRACKSLLDRYKLYNPTYWGLSQDELEARHQQGQAKIKDKRHNLIVLASWTCLQLESDILAEMRLPSSGITTLEDVLPMPQNMQDNEDADYQGVKLTQESDSDGRILVLYTAQMFLRKRLNQIHKEMYGDHCLNQSLSQVKVMLTQHEAMLERWRTGLPPPYMWNDPDPPASDILEARLRAKYWGARYIANRPFLDYALHVLPHTKEGRTIEASALDSHGNPRDRAELHLFKAISQMPEDSIWEATRRCIEAAMQSTVAFDGVPDRLIVTGIHGTAHAQFGNMLVLSATHHNTWLKAFVPAWRFEPLLERTIKFLGHLAPISPTSQADLKILQKIQACIFGGSPPGLKQDPGEASVSRSFGSNI